MKMKRTNLIRLIEILPRGEDTCVSKSVRGHTVWTVWKRPDESKYIVCSYLKKDAAGWHMIKEETEDSPPVDENCPQKYLDMCAPIDVEWRKRVKILPTLKRARKKEIRELFKQGYALRITISPPEGFDRLTQYIFDIEEVHTNRPVGRSIKDGKLYSIPLNLISNIEKIGEPNVKKKRKYCKKAQ